MKLLKCKDGKLEMGNFFLTSNFFNFAENDVERDLSKGLLKLNSNTRLERNFNYREFVLEVEKENIDLKEDEYCQLYFDTKKINFGIKEEYQDNQNKFWKIIKCDDFIQAYASKDKIDYENLGGMKQEESIKTMGFKKYSDKPLILKGYKIYSNPFVVIKNFNQGTLCELYAEDSRLVDAKVFNEEMECRFLLNYIFKGYFIFKDLQGKEIYRSNILNLSYGDEYILSPYHFEIIYKGQIVGTENPTTLDSLFELITIKNISKSTYKNILVGIDNFSDEIIQISLDGTNFYDEVKFENFETLTERNVFVRIQRTKKGFGVRNFNLTVTGG
ncbi:hypothetical protein [Clostridium botulinum]|uniref:hypothetical protein n=1 Tax=Clostridium botulinum TaxID=1491 RepID=UPI001E40D2A5|nr:hypothetical protein [Clostridium botulinum]MCD3223834.1 hypothetical protein [Clostridium botulinum C/D]MCD3295266.1 hypothetical protein [Clostridium botulinum C/D]